MPFRRIALRFVPLLFSVGCMSSTECDCIAPTITIAGTVTGAASAAIVRIEARTTQSPCRADDTAAGSISVADAQPDGTYRVGVPLPAPGPACVVVTATKLADRPVTVTSRIEATITKMPATGPQEVRVDIAFTS